MRTITIGRDPQCDVYINDERISRRQALLKIYGLGYKMELVDLGSNGTYVNGVKLSPNVPFPVSRKNTISFANVRQLDWDDVPNPLRKIKWAFFGLVALVAVIAIVSAIFSLVSTFTPSYDDYEEVVVEKSDSRGNTTDRKSDAKDERTEFFDKNNRNNKSQSKDTGKGTSKDTYDGTEGSHSSAQWWEIEMAKEIAKSKPTSEPNSVSSQNKTSETKAKENNDAKATTTPQEKKTSEKKINKRL